MDTICDGRDGQPEVTILQQNISWSVQNIKQKFKLLQLLYYVTGDVYLKT